MYQVFTLSMVIRTRKAQACDWSGAETAISLYFARVEKAGGNVIQDAIDSGGGLREAGVRGFAR